MKLTWQNSSKKVKIKKFSSHTGPTCILPSTILEVFLLFFTEELLGMITDQSNLYAAQTMGEETYSQWNKITIEELKAYLGFYILMGLVQLPSMYDYWSTNPIYRYSVIADRITRDRFFEIHKYLHFSDNQRLAQYGSPSHDKLGKVRPVIDYLNNRFITMYDPHCEMAIDEAMIKFKGHSSLKQYMPKKPIKRGFKVWVRGDSINGYVSELEVYAGKVTEKGEKGLGRHVVEKLCNTLAGRHHHIYFDNFFTSIPLLLSLRQNGLYGCGTMKANRLGFPAQFTPKMKKGLPNRGDSMALQNEELTCCLWQDTKPVVVISSFSQPDEKAKVKRKKHDGSTIEIDCPMAIHQYNKYMGGVDLNDQLRNYHTYSFKSRKFYKYIFFFLFHLSITNSFLLTKHYCPTISVRNIKQFRERLAMSLIGTYKSRKRSYRTSINSASVKRPTLSHFPRRGSDTMHRCYYCYHTLSRRRQTNWYCQDCDLYLCHKGGTDDCFYLYHSTL